MTRLSSGRVAVIGCGAVGSAYAFALLSTGLARELALMDARAERAEGEAMDLQHALPFTHPSHVEAVTLDGVTQTDLIVITAGVGQRPGESRLELVERNIAVLRSLVPALAAQNPDALFLMVSNPVDVLTYATWRLSGFPPDRVFGSGTVLDSARFRSLLAEYCDVDARNVHAYVVGEHGDSEVMLWSRAMVAGVPIADFCAWRGQPFDAAVQDRIATQVRRAAYEIIQRKGATSYAIAMSLIRITECIFRDEHSLLPVSSLLQHYQGVTDVCVSVPTVVGRTGIQQQVPVTMTPEETAAFHASAAVVQEAIRALGL